jgi:hypothetical protein
MKVVVGDPAEQSEQARRECGDLVIKDIEHFTDLA